MANFESKKDVAPSNADSAAEASLTETRGTSAPKNNPNSISLSDFRNLKMPTKFREYLPGTGSYIETGHTSKGFGQEIKYLGIDTKVTNQGFSVKSLDSDTGTRIENNEILEVLRDGHFKGDKYIDTELKFGPQSLNFKTVLEDPFSDDPIKASLTGRIHQSYNGDGTTGNLQFDSPNLSVNGIVSNGEKTIGYGVGVRKKLSPELSVEASYAKNIDFCEEEKSVSLEYKSSEGLKIQAKGLHCDGVNGVSTTLSKDQVELGLKGTTNGYGRADLEVGNNIVSIEHSKGTTRSFLGKKLHSVIGSRNIFTGIANFFMQDVYVGVAHEAVDGGRDSTSIGVDVKVNLSLAKDTLKK